MIAPGCVLTTVDHPKSAAARAGLVSFAAPVSISISVWIGDNCTVFAEVAIGDNSVVNRDVAANTVVAGSPIRTIRENL